MTAIINFLPQSLEISTEVSKGLGLEAEVSKGPGLEAEVSQVPGLKNDKVQSPITTGAETKNPEFDKTTDKGEFEQFLQNQISGEETSEQQKTPEEIDDARLKIAEPSSADALEATKIGLSVEKLALSNELEFLQAKPQPDLQTSRELTAAKLNLPSNTDILNLQSQDRPVVQSDSSRTGITDQPQSLKSTAATAASQVETANKPLTTLTEPEATLTSTAPSKTRSVSINSGNLDSKPLPADPGTVKLWDSLGQGRVTPGTSELKPGIELPPVSGKILPASGKELPPIAAQTPGQDLTSKAVQMGPSNNSMTNSEPKAQTATEQTAKVIDNIKLSVPADKLPTVAEVDQKPVVKPDSLTTMDGLKLLNNKERPSSQSISIEQKIEQFKQSPVINRPQTIAGELTLQVKPATVAKEPSLALQPSQSDSQASSFLANYQKPMDSKPLTASDADFAKFLSSRLQTDNAQWKNDLTGRIRWMSDLNVSSAKLKLHPVELGSLEIMISSEDKQTRVSFITSTLAAKEMIESSMPRLRELLGSSGLLLEQGDVTHQEAGPDHSANRQLAVNEDAITNSKVETDPIEQSQHFFRRTDSNLRVDHYV